MKQLSYKDIVIGKKYVITDARYDFSIGDVVTAIGEEGGAYHNDGETYGFINEDGVWNYVGYDCIQEQEIDMKDMVGKFTVGDLFKVVEGDEWFTEGSIIKLHRDDGSACPHFELVKGKSKDNGKWYMCYEQLEPIYTQEVEQEVEQPFAPFTLTVDTLEDFEVLKGIMHLHNKVSGSSFFNLDWAPRPHKVKAFMMDAFDRMDTHRKGWSEYKKGE